MPLQRRTSLLAVGIAILALVAWQLLRPRDQPDALTGRADAAEQLAAHLAAHHPGSRALVIGNPYTQQTGHSSQARAYQDTVLGGLRRGFGEHIDIVAVAYPALKPGAAENPRQYAIPASVTTPLSYLVTDDAFETLVASHPADIVISLIGIPTRLTEQPGWTDPRSPAFAFYLPDLWMLGDPTDIRRAFASGRIVAAVVPDPDPASSPGSFRVLSTDDIAGSESVH